MSIQVQRTKGEITGWILALFSMKDDPYIQDDKINCILSVLEKQITEYTTEIEINPNILKNTKVTEPVIKIKNVYTNTTYLIFNIFKSDDGTVEYRTCTENYTMYTIHKAPYIKRF